MKIGPYRVLRLIGKGSFGRVVLAAHEEQAERLFVIKVVKSTAPGEAVVEAQREVTTLRALAHPNIVELVDAFVVEGRLCIVMPYCDGGDLAGQIKAARARGDAGLPEEQILDWLVQLVLALTYLHDQRVLHRDLKPANIFLTRRTSLVKLGDFGLTKTLEHTLSLARTAVGTPYYISPEIVRGQQYGFKSDVWALGCVLYEMMALRVPFQAADLRELRQRILGDKPRAPSRRRYSLPLLQLVGTMLSKAPQRRPSVRQVAATPLMQAAMARFAARHGFGPAAPAAPAAAPAAPTPTAVADNRARVLAAKREREQRARDEHEAALRAERERMARQRDEARERERLQFEASLTMDEASADELAATEELHRMSSDGEDAGRLRESVALASGSGASGAGAGAGAEGDVPDDDGEEIGEEIGEEHDGFDEHQQALGDLGRALLRDQGARRVSDSILSRPSDFEAGLDPARVAAARDMDRRASALAPRSPPLVGRGSPGRAGGRLAPL